MIQNYKFAKGEKLNIIGHSHGGNVGILVSHLINRKIDNLVTLGTPIREYFPDYSNVGKAYNFYSNSDEVQIRGGIDSINLFSSANRTLVGAQNVEVPINNGPIDTHSDLHTADVWRKYVHPYIK